MGHALEEPMPEISATMESEAVRRASIPRQLRKKGLDDNDSWVDDDFFQDSEDAFPPRRTAQDLAEATEL